MPIRCQCHVITEEQFVAIIEENRTTIENMCLTKAAKFVFEQARGDTKKGETKHRCPRPCHGVIRELINDMESQAVPTHCRGYQDPLECHAATLITGWLHEMK